MAWQEWIPKIVTPSPGASVDLPLIQGKFKASIKGWTKVYFSKKFSAPPTVVALGEVRSGWFTPDKISISRVTIPEVTPLSVKPLPSFDLQTVRLPDLPQLKSIYVPSLTLPSYTLNIPRINRSDLASELQNKVQAEAQNRLGDWSLLNWARDKIAWMIGGVGWIIGSMLNWLWDTLIQSQINNVEESVENTTNTLIEKVRSSIQTQVDQFKTNIESNLNKSISEVNAAVSDIRRNVENSINTSIDQMNTRISAFISDLNSTLSGITSGANRALTSGRDSINTALSQTSGTVETSINTTIPKLWTMLGLDSGMLFTPVNIRNVASESFEFYALSPGMVVNYIAVGV